MQYIFPSVIIDDEAEKIIADQYVSALLPPKPPSPRRPKPERPAEEWEKDKEELKKCELQKYMIRTKDLPPYFQTHEGKQLCIKVHCTFLSINIFFRM